MTESCSCITARHLEKFTYEYPYCVAIIVADTEVKIVNPETRKGLHYNDHGGIMARGPRVVTGYLYSEKAPP